MNCLRENIFKYSTIFALLILKCYDFCFSRSGQNLNKPVSQSGCGISSSNDKLLDKIINGDRVDLGSFPWVVSIIYSQNNQYFHVCGGVLISHEHVLSSAACFADYTNLNDLFVLLGTGFIEDVPKEKIFLKFWLYIHIHYTTGKLG